MHLKDPVAKFKEVATKVIENLYQDGVLTPAERANATGLMDVIATEENGAETGTWAGMVQMMIEDINQARTPLMRAVMNNNSDYAMTAIMDGANLNARDKDWKTALMYAAQYGNIEMVQFLVVGGANVHAKDALGQTVVMYAAENKDPQVLDFFIKMGLDVNTQSKYGETALKKAVEKGPAKTVQLLLDAGADATVTDGYKETLVMKAVRVGSVKKVKALVAAGADVHAKDAGGKNALDILASYRTMRARLNDAEIRSVLEKAYGFPSIVVAQHLGDVQTMDKVVSVQGAVPTTQGVHPSDVQLMVKGMER